MLCILSTNPNIYFQLAAEEYLLKNTREEICMLWQSDDAVVIGKHQNAMGEVNYLWCLENKIPVARRLSGGGTVFHGKGNLNFTFIKNGEKGKLVDFKRFVRPVVEFLKSLSIPAEIGTRNDILIRGLKISGNAEHVYKSRVLHHGTLLFDADLSKLNQSIKVPVGKYTSKAVQSVRSQVSNISGFMPEKISLKEFIHSLFQFLMTSENSSQEYCFTAKEQTLIEKLVNEKYTTWEWIYGYSPKFELTTAAIIQNRNFSIHMLIEKGLITNSSIRGTEDHSLFSELNKRLYGLKYEIEAITTLLVELGFDEASARKTSRHFF